MPTARTDSRRFHCYSIGTGKTGTHSMAGIFGKNYRAAHEPECELLISTVFEIAEGRKSQDEVRSFLRMRDKRLFLELESDGTLYHFHNLLLSEFPDSKFFLTIRDCYTWLESVLNHNLGASSRGFWRKYDDLKYAQWHFQHAEEEEILAQHGLRTLGHYLNHWTTHNQTIIANTPKERLMVVRTDRIRQSAAEIAAFVGVPAQTLDVTKSHLFVNPQKFNILSRIKPTFLEDSIGRYCGQLMQEYFPEIDNYDRAVAAR